MKHLKVTRLEYDPETRELLVQISGKELYHHYAVDIQSYTEFRDTPADKQVLYYYSTIFPKFPRKS